MFFKEQPPKTVSNQSLPPPQPHHHLITITHNTILMTILTNILTTDFVTFKLLHILFRLKLMNK